MSIRIHRVRSKVMCHAPPGSQVSMYICISHIQTVAHCHLLTMPVLNNNQTIKLPFDISTLDSLYQPYRYTEYNVCDDTCESDLNDHFAKIFPNCKYHSANEFNTCNRNPKCLPGVSFIHLNARTQSKLKL